MDLERKREREKGEGTMMKGKERRKNAIERKRAKDTKK